MTCGSHFFFSSSEPWPTTMPIANMAAWIAAPAPPEQLISSVMTDASVTPRPQPPYSSGIITECRPAVSAAFANSSGKASFSSTSR